MKTFGKILMKENKITEISVLNHWFFLWKNKINENLAKEEEIIQLKKENDGMKRKIDVLMRQNKSLDRKLLELENQKEWINTLFQTKKRKFDDHEDI